jgi:hypothetical protein
MSKKTTDLVNEINDAFNKQNVQQFKDQVADNVVVHRIAKDGQVTTKIGKQDYLDYLKDTWQRLKHPKSENLSVTTTQMAGGISKAIVLYDSTFTPPNQAKEVTEPATAIMYFDASDKLVDATYATR